MQTYQRANNVGYKKGDKLMVGMSVSNSNLTGIRLLYPFNFYRYDENGFCYLQNNNLSKINDQDVFFLNFLINLKFIRMLNLE